MTRRADGRSLVRLRPDRVRPRPVFRLEGLVAENRSSQQTGWGTGRALRRLSGSGSICANRTRGGTGRNCHTSSLRYEHMFGVVGDVERALAKLVAVPDVIDVAKINQLRNQLEFVWLRALDAYARSEQWVEDGHPVPASVCASRAASHNSLQTATLRWDDICASCRRSRTRSQEARSPAGISNGSRTPARLSGSTRCARSKRRCSTRRG